MYLRKTIALSTGILIAVAGFAQQVSKVKVTDIEKMIRESDTPLVINFWATFCKPCIEEMPYFETMAAKYKERGMKLVFVSLDLQDAYPKQVQNFVVKRKVKNPVVWLDETNADYFLPKIDTQWSGSIPATLFINNKKGYRKFMEEQLSQAALEKEIMAVL